jgi:hypothetical protein
MLSSLNPFDSGETLRAKWGEFFPAPAKIRLQIVDSGVQNVLSCVQSGEANTDRTNISAKRAVDEVVKLDVVASNLTAAQEGQRTDEVAAPATQEGPVNSVLNTEAIRENLNHIFEVTGA